LRPLSGGKLMSSSELAQPKRKRMITPASCWNLPKVIHSPLSPHPSGSPQKREVYEGYGITLHDCGDYDLDHRIPLELGGANSIKNLWPQFRLKQL
jgi:5-methylcytosine-specific restriction endonuclease McrA